MVEEKIPAFCSVCGTRLIANNEIQSYDVFTGHPLQSSIFTCPNPTVEVSKTLLTTRTRKTEHPVWQNINNSWESY